ncbi:hypothetical protein LJC61_01030 [Ruminococcaceae bacterium OttesenSCG-928-A16]|nr:hypothetical protein [Ruminococcaceae bacterium OttesenSCG-928-A16]
MNIFNRKAKRVAASKNIPKEDYFISASFESHRKRVASKLAGLPKQTPPGWSERTGLAISGLTYVAFDDESRYLLIVSSSGRGVFDLQLGQMVARDKSTNEDWLDEQRLLCNGIGPIQNKKLRITGIGGGGLPIGTNRGESLFVAAPHFPAYDVIYQPNHQMCLHENKDKDCVVLYSGYVKFCGFSWDGNTMVVVDEDVNVWTRK